jgi:curved DNA-binding protein CbpA
MAQDYYAILGVPRTASTADIRQAYARLAREKHPDRFADAAERARAHELFREITTAFNTLSSDKNRREYDQSLERPQPQGPEEIARDAYARGTAALAGGRAEEAVELLRSAVHHGGQHARHHAALAVALARHPQTMREAIQCAERAAQLEPAAASHQVLLAELLLSQGLKLRARRAAEGALRLNPADTRAKRVLDEASS